MGGIFGGGESRRGQRNLRLNTKKYIGDALDKLTYAPIGNALAAERARLDGQGFMPTSLSGPGYGIKIDGSGNIAMDRTSETQGFMDAIRRGLGTDEKAYGKLLSQITPGFGRLTRSVSDRWDNARDRAVSNLRDQLARRRVAGSSFANDQIGSMERQYLMDKDAELNEALVQELKMTQEVIGARTTSRNATIAQAFDQIQFEGNLGGQLMQSVLANQNNLQMAMVDLAKTGAMIQADIQKAEAGVVTGLRGTETGQASSFADIAAREAAGPGQLIGTIAGTALGGWASGGFGGLSGIGNGLSSGVIPSTSMGAGTFGPTSIGNMPWL